MASYTLEEARDLKDRILRNDNGLLADFHYWIKGGMYRVFYDFLKGTKDSHRSLKEREAARRENAKIMLANFMANHEELFESIAVEVLGRCSEPAERGPDRTLPRRQIPKDLPLAAVFNTLGRAIGARMISPDVYDSCLPSHGKIDVGGHGTDGVPDLTSVKAKLRRLVHDHVSDEERRERVESVLFEILDSDTRDEPLSASDVAAYAGVGLAEAVDLLKTIRVILTDYEFDDDPKRTQDSGANDDGGME